MIGDIFSNIKFRIILAFIIAFFSVKSLSSTVFLGNSPGINPEFIYSVKNIPVYIVGFPNRIHTYIAGLFRQNQKFEYSNISKVPQSKFIPVAKGVDAYENKSTNEVYIKVGVNAEFDKKIIKGPNGKEFIIYYPKQ